MPAGVASALAARPVVTSSTPAPAQHTVAPSSADAHVFDVVHPILLSHVRRHNSAGVVALLGLPELANAPLFWQTCTYRAGLVGALITFVVEQTGQHTVPWPAGRRQPGWTSSAPDGDGGASTPSPLQEKEGTLHKEGDSDASVQAASPVAAAAAVAAEGRSGLGAAPLTPRDLYCLVHRCLYPAHHRLPDWLACGSLEDEAVGQAEGRRREEGETTMASGQPPPAYTVMLNALLSPHSVTPAASSVLFQSRAGDGDAVHRLRESCSGVGGDRAALQDARDLQRYLSSVLTQLERIIRAQGTCTQQPPSLASSGAHTHPSPKRDPPKRVREGGDDAVQLDALAAVLLEHYSDFTYSHPRLESLAEAQAHDETFTDSEQSGASLVASGNGRSVTPPPARTSADSSAVAPVSAARNTKGSAPQGSEPNGRDSSSSSRPKNSTDTPAPTHTEPLQQIQEAESRTEVDAVTMLQRLPALSATRWSVAASAPAAAAAETQRRQEDERPTAGTAAASTNAASQPSAPVPASKRGTGSSPEKTAVPPARMTQQQRDAEAARVAAAIHAFDAFTASLEQLQPSSTARPAQHTAGGNSSSNKNSGGVHEAASRQGGFVESQRQRGTSARTSAAPSSAAVVPAAPPPPPSPTTRKQPPSSSVAAPAAPAAPAAAPAGREPRRRHKFSAKEDAAILQGVGRFGQGPGAFQYVFHAYRNVWREGRTATHLYDHWRGALRRRAVAAVSAEALGSVGEGEGEEEGEEEGGEGGREGSRGERENGRGRRGGRTGRARADWAEQELSSDIESSEEESDE